MDEPKFFVKSVKFNQEQKVALDKILQDEKISFSTLVKRRIFLSREEEKEIIYNSKKLAKLSQTALAKNELAFQVRAIGNNLNQIAKVANEKKAVDLLTVQKLEQIKEQLEKIC